MDINTFVINLNSKSSSSSSQVSNIGVSVKAVSKHRPSYFTPKIKFTPQEDQMLYNAVAQYGTSDWRLVSAKVEGRNARQCRERWTNYINPSIVATPWTKEDDELLLKKYEENGPRWHTISSFFATRSTNSVKNRYVTLMRHQRKREKKEKLIREKEREKKEMENQLLTKNSEVRKTEFEPKGLWAEKKESFEFASNKAFKADEDSAEQQEIKDPFSFLDILKEKDSIFWTNEFDSVGQNWLLSFSF